MMDWHLSRIQLLSVVCKEKNFFVEFFGIRLLCIDRLRDYNVKDMNLKD